MKKLISLVALAAISFGSVYAHTTVIKAKTMQMDTTKKKKMKMKKDSSMKDTTHHVQK